MRYIESILTGLLFVAAVAAQTPLKSTSSYFDDSPSRDLASKSILIRGEVENPGMVDLRSLPIRSVAVKEMGIENGKPVFKGAFFVNGYALYDILNTTNFKKAPENTFHSAVDLYVLVENDKGVTAAFSWGEIYYRNSFDILIAKTIEPINPARAKVSYALPNAPMLICAGDLLNARYLSNPTKITVKSWRGMMPKDKPKDIYSPELRIIAKTGNFVIGEVDESVPKRTYSDVGYGHGMGFHGYGNVTGYLLKDLLTTKLKPTPEMLREWLAVGSAKDGYRVVYSLSEIMNRGDNQDILLVDKKEDKTSGRYLLYPPDDFFADRDIRSIDALELFTPRLGKQ